MAALSFMRIALAALGCAGATTFLDETSHLIQKSVTYSRDPPAKLVLKDASEDDRSAVAELTEDLSAELAEDSGSGSGNNVGDAKEKKARQMAKRLSGLSVSSIKSKIAEQQAKLARATKSLQKARRNKEYDNRQKVLAKQQKDQEEERMRRKVIYDREVAGRDVKKQHDAKIKADLEAAAKAHADARAAIEAADTQKLHVDAGTILIKVRCSAKPEFAGKGPLLMTVQRSGRMGVMAEAGAKHFGLKDINKVRLVAKGEVVKRGDTVDMHDLQDGDTVEVMEAK